MMNRVRNVTRKVGNAASTAVAKIQLGISDIKGAYNSTLGPKYGGKRKTRKMRRGTKRLHRMRGRGLMNTMRTMKNKLTPSEETLRQATFAITPSQAKQNWVKNKAGKAVNLTMRGVKGVGKGAYSVVKGVAKAPTLLGNLLVEASR